MRKALCILVATLALLVPATTAQAAQITLGYVQLVPEQYTAGYWWFSPITWGNTSTSINYNWSVGSQDTGLAATGETVGDPNTAGTSSVADHRLYHIHYCPEGGSWQGVPVRQPHSPILAPWMPTSWGHINVPPGVGFDYYLEFWDDNSGTNVTYVPGGASEPNEAGEYLHATAPQSPDDPDDFNMAVYSDLDLHSDGDGWQQLTESGDAETRSEDKILSDFHGGTIDADLAVFAGDAYKEDGTQTEMEVRMRFNTFAERNLGGLLTFKAFGDNDDSDVSGAQALIDHVAQDGANEYWATQSSDVNYIFLDTSWWVGDTMRYEETIGLDTFNWDGSGSPDFTAGSDQADWLKTELDSVTSDGTADANVVVVMHQPLIRDKTNNNSVSGTVNATTPADGSFTARPWADSFYSTSLGRWVDRPGYGSRYAEREDILDLFAYYGVDLVLTGHTHVFRRSNIIVTKNSTTYYIPQIQVPPIQSGPREVPSETTAPSDVLPAINLDHWSSGTAWAIADNEQVYDGSDFAHSGSHNSTDWHGFLNLSWDASLDRWSLQVYKDSESNSLTEIGSLADSTLDAVPTGCDYNQYGDANN